MPTTDHESAASMSSATSLDFAGRFPSLSLDDDASPLGLDDFSEENLMELLHALDGSAGETKEAEPADLQSDDNDDIKVEKSNYEDAPTVDTNAPNDKTTRVRTYTARKQEIARLLKELPHLEGYVDLLKHQAAKAHNQTDSLEKTRLINATLRDSIHRQQYTLARLESAISLYRTRQERMIPIDTFVHLSRDPAQRLSTVAALRPRLLRDALRFIRERTWFVDHSVPCTEQTAFTGASGDRCAVKFCVSPIEGSTNVKQAFDALRFYIGHTDVMITEATGDVITREDRTNFVDGGVHNTHQSRLVRAMAKGFAVESNAIVFADYQPQDDEFGGGRALGIIITAAVGKDDQFPYSPDTRLRRDLTSVMLVKTYVRSDSEMGKSGDPTKKRNGKDSRSRYGVVMVRHSFHRLHRGNVPISNIDLSNVCDQLLAEGNVLFDTVQASVDDSVAADFPAQHSLKNDHVTSIDRLPQSPVV